MIPARMGSSRFPGKPLAPLLGRPMVEHVVRRAAMCEQLDAVYVATCDEEIRAAVEGFGGEVIMTSDAHERASDRVAEAAERFEAEVVVMIQGDEPLVTPRMIAASVAPLYEDASVSCVNLARRITKHEDYLDRNTIKVLMNVRGDAVYFSRAPVPDAAALRALAALRPSSVRRAFRLARRLHRRYEFFKVLRVLELLGYYARYLALFRGGRFRLAVMSSHSNPHGIAFNLAARRCGVSVVLVTHGMPVRPVAQLSYDLALVHCEAARQTYEEEGCRLRRVLVHGRRQAHAPMSDAPLAERLSVGLFLCKDVNEERLRGLVERLLADTRVARVLIRPHPKNLWRGLEEWVESRREPRLGLSKGQTVFQDIASSDLVLAGNSSVLAEALTAGRPAAYVRGIDYGSYDLHAFVARGLVYEYADERGLDTEAMRRFYLRPDWPSALRLFANVDEDEASVALRTRDALREIASVLTAQMSGADESVAVR